MVNPRTRTLMLAMAIMALALAATMAVGCSPATPPTATTTTPAATTAPAVEPTVAAVTGIDLGKQIWDTGNGVSGPIAHQYGIAKIKVQACKNCHGENGKGGKGLAGPDIRGSKLQPDFNEVLFARAVTQGLDEAGKKLESKMPHFSATPEETAALWLYVNSLK